MTVQELIRRIELNTSALGIRLYPRASESEIAAFEKYLGAAMPEDMKTFYRFCNGFESEEDLFRIIPLEEIMTRPVSSSTPDFVDFDFAEYLIYIDTWYITLSKTDHRDYLISNGEADKSVILTDSFVKFTDRFLQGGVFDGLYNLPWK